MDGEVKGFFHFFLAWILAFFVWNLVFKPYIFTPVVNMLPPSIATPLQTAV